LGATRKALAGGGAGASVGTEALVVGIRNLVVSGVTLIDYTITTEDP